ncbi:Molybdopterin-guanine dinucleotide biosynthesis protein MobA [Nocardioides sp. AX2bis]|nr:Molybdopterin-guanine dinucleotide biosynthesis protein MobA [Nocardioides sp. AX2bis]
MPKALVHDPDGRPWLRRAVAVLRDGGCDRVVVVLGARAEEARPLVPAGAEVVVADAWADGLSASLVAGLAHLGRDDGATRPDAALVLLVDLPDLVPAVVARLLPAAAPGALARAAYDGEPGHPVVLGRDHWGGVTATAEGDEGAKAYLRRHRAEVHLVECGDLATGADQDRPGPS